MASRSPWVLSWLRIKTMLRRKSDVSSPYLATGSCGTIGSVMAAPRPVAAIAMMGSMGLLSTLLMINALSCAGTSVLIREELGVSRSSVWGSAESNSYHSLSKTAAIFFSMSILIKSDLRFIIDASVVGAIEARLASVRLLQCLDFRSSSMTSYTLDMKYHLAKLL